jgi:hypothetical protein
MKSIFTFLFYCFSITIVFSQGVSLPYNSGFDSAPEKAGWQQYRTGFLSTYSWGYSAGASSGTTCVSHDYNVGGNSGDIVIDWYVSPPLNLTTTSKLSLKVKTGGFSTPTPDNFEILYGTDKQNPATGNFTVIANLSYMLPQNQWRDTTINIPFVSDSGYIALKYKTIGAAWSTYAFDNISISADPVSIYESNSKKNGTTCFPNPFSAQTIIQTDKVLTDATFTVYNTQGQQVKQLINISGQRIIFDRGNLSKGLYFYRLTEDNTSISTEKLVIFD